MSTRRPSPSPSHSPPVPSPPTRPPGSAPLATLGSAALHTPTYTLCTAAGARIEAEVDTRDSRIAVVAAARVRSRREHRCPEREAKPRPPQQPSSAGGGAGRAPRAAAAGRAAGTNAASTAAAAEAPAEGGHRPPLPRRRPRQPRRRRPRRRTRRIPTRSARRGPRLSLTAPPRWERRRRRRSPRARHIQACGSGSNACRGSPTSSLLMTLRRTAPKIGSACRRRADASTASNARCARRRSKSQGRTPCPRWPVRSEAGSWRRKRSAAREKSAVVPNNKSPNKRGCLSIYF